MKAQIAFTILIGTAMIACTQNAPETVRTSVLEPIGFGTITFVDDTQGQPALNLKAKALGNYDGGFIQLKRISVNSFTVGARPSATTVGGYRYVSFTFAVRNASETGVASLSARSNLTIIPVSVASGAHTTINSPMTTPFSALGKFNGTAANSSIAQDVQPTHGSSFDPFTGLAQVNDNQADLQVFSEAEMTNFVTSASGWPSTHTPFPYGYVVRSKYNSGNRTLNGKPPVGQFDGLVTFGFKVPLQATVIDDPFVYSVEFVVVQDNVARVTKSNEESSATRAQAEATALGGSTVVDSSVCDVRYAGDPNGFYSPKYLYGFGAKQAFSSTLDHCYGSTGASAAFFGGSRGNAAVLGPNDNTLIAGGAGDFLRSRYQLSGNGGGGVQSNYDFSGFDDEAFAIVLQPDGKTLLAGQSRNSLGNDDFALLRFDENQPFSNFLDLSFGTGGKVTVDFAGLQDQAKAMVLQPDGKILVAGNTYTSLNKNDFAVARFNANGTLDSSFGTGGKVKVDFGGRYDFAKAMALQPDGKIVLAGTTSGPTPTSSDFGLARLMPNGTLDSGFGLNGLATLDFASSYDTANAMVLQSDGKILIAGEVTSPYSKFGMARFGVNGILDTTFGTNGKVTRSTYGFYDSANAIALQADGKILLGGITKFSAGSDSDFILARFNPDGTVDYGFAGNTDPVDIYQQSEDSLNVILVQPDGRIRVVGTAMSSGNSAIALARYNP
jgi:uncharacterized delta-60 repeat protein